jgi:hypothetical protein
MPSSCAVSGSVTMPWQPTVTPTAPIPHASSRSVCPLSSTCSPHVPPCTGNGASPRSTFRRQAANHFPSSQGVHISPCCAMPCLTLRRHRGVYLPSLQHPRSPKTTRGFNRACACTAARNRANPDRATNCARDAERKLARASCGPAIPSHYVTRSSLPSRKPHSHHASFPRSMNRNKLRLRCAHRGTRARFGRRWRRWRHTTAPGLSPHNLACLQALVAAALFLAGTLGSSWFAVLEVLQNADFVLAIPGTAPPGLAPLDIDGVAGTPSKRGGTQIEGQVNSNNRHQVATHPLLADVDSESVHAISAAV